MIKKTEFGKLHSVLFERLKKQTKKHSSSWNFSSFKSSSHARKVYHISYTDAFQSWKRSERGRTLPHFQTITKSSLLVTRHPAVIRVLVTVTWYCSSCWIISSVPCWGQSASQWLSPLFCKYCPPYWSRYLGSESAPKSLADWLSSVTDWDCVAVCGC